MLINVFLLNINTLIMKYRMSYITDHCSELLPYCFYQIFKNKGPNQEE
jgi:hypothetical protein